MPRISDLPVVAIERITQLARGQVILGTDTNACVCRQWKDASSDEEAQPLQLFLDLQYISLPDMLRAATWMAKHGQQMEVVVIDGRAVQLVHEGWLHIQLLLLCTCQNLRRLELQHEHSLALLAPVLGQLPQLQHLAAAVAMEVWDQSEDENEGGEAAQVQEGEFWAQKEVLKVPDMGQLCPQLTYLSVTLEANGDTVRVDERLPRLLPPTLQQLALSNGTRVHTYPLVPSRHLSHLTALQQLRLEGVEVEGQGDVQLAQHLAPLQQLRVVDPVHTSVTAAAVHLAPLVVEYQGRGNLREGLPPAMTRWVHLTRLVLDTHSSLPEGTAGALAALSSLKELGLSVGRMDTTVEAAVHQAAGMVQLRSLKLKGHIESPAALSAALVQCTQLTSLHLAVTSPDATSSEGVCYMAVPEQQLVGLRALTVPAELLEQQQGAWLAPLTALTRLGVKLPVRQRWDPPQEPLTHEACQEAQWQWYEAQEQGVHDAAGRLLEQVQAWPAAMQQVVFWAPRRLLVTGFQPRRWQHTPAASPGRPGFTVWLEDVGPYTYSTAAPGWARPFAPCPHLPGVWQLQGEGCVEPLLVPQYF
jgi:hypothetical protein